MKPRVSSPPPLAKTLKKVHVHAHDMHMHMYMSLHQRLSYLYQRAPPGVRSDALPRPHRVRRRRRRCRRPRGSRA